MNFSWSVGEVPSSVATLSHISYKCWISSFSKKRYLALSTLIRPMTIPVKVKLSPVTTAIVLVAPAAENLNSGCFGSCKNRWPWKLEEMSGADQLGAYDGRPISSEPGKVRVITSSLCEPSISDRAKFVNTVLVGI